ncbi:MAG: hypothetical protein VX257_09275 [Planctomycetota bacterium]|nr:hypothetical protein [Planctomycetota bacterium]
MSNRNRSLKLRQSEGIWPRVKRWAARPDGCVLCGKIVTEHL